eukprot:CAMPEP_0116825852 /NCGR_PEP_ID=MMETSP0418-20121206/2207_1 /TAXON_ID=1158023 /ORGANISM="Astrosyne radiata, Strain 13vi08-1A" /LENGTH=41 /DNA_ID= /DNA_START= /DNA_END= /DNA_ORIENTATION=
MTASSAMMGSLSGVAIPSTTALRENVLCRWGTYANEDVWRA